MLSIRLKINIKNHMLKYTLKVAKKTDARMRNFSNVKNQRLYRRYAHQLYAQNAPDRVGCQS